MATVVAVATMIAMASVIAMAAVIAVARAIVVAESKIQFDRRTDIRGVAAAVIRIVARVRRSVHRTSAESSGQQECGRASFQRTCASSSHVSPQTVNLNPV